MAWSSPRKMLRWMQFVAIAIVDFYDYLTKEMIVPHRKAIPKLHTQSQFDTDALSAHNITVFMFPFVPSFYFLTHTHIGFIIVAKMFVCLFQTIGQLFATTVKEKTRSQNHKNCALEINHLLVVLCVNGRNTLLNDERESLLHFDWKDDPWS